MLIDMPCEIMKQTPATTKLWEDKPYHVAFGPERNIVSWPMTKRQVYHLQLCDYDYRQGERYGFHDQPESPYISTITDTTGLKQRWSDYGPQTQHILNATTHYTNWKIAELPPMHRYTSSFGRVWLLGDACHAVQPFAGQGANMAFEDAESIATLLNMISSKGQDQLQRAAEVYNQVRIPRLAGLRKIIDFNVRQFGMADGEEQQKRDAKLLSMKIEGEREHGQGYASDAQAQVSIISRSTNQGRFAWLENYDAAAEVSWLQWVS